MANLINVANLLGTIYVNQTDEKSVNDLMTKNGYAYEYHGGTKKINCICNWN